MWNLDNSYARLPDSLHQAQPPVPVPAPRLLLLNQPLAEALGLSVAELDSAEGVAVLAGNALPAGSQPLAQAYAGHQFGHFTLLGDGRAVLLGEQLAQDGQRYDIQLKGSGMTPFSRRGDGRAALGPMLREYIISEALHGLGIPCTRSLAVVASGDTVLRPLPQPGAVLTRVAASHVRVGTFEYAIRRGGAELVRALADWCIERHYPHCRAADNPLAGPAAGGGGAPGSADCALDAGRLYPRGDEYRQHEHCRREHRLRPLCLYGCLQPSSGVQFD